MENCWDRIFVLTEADVANQTTDDRLQRQRNVSGSKCLAFNPCFLIAGHQRESAIRNYWTMRPGWPWCPLSYFYTQCTNLYRRACSSASVREFISKGLWGGSLQKWLVFEWKIKSGQKEGFLDSGRNQWLANRKSFSCVWQNGKADPIPQDEEEQWPEIHCSPLRKHDILSRIFVCY